MKEIISILILLFFPILYKMVKDWNGFDHTKPNMEFENLIIIMIITGFFVKLPYLDLKHHHGLTWQFVFSFKEFLVSVFGFQLIFPYLINWRLSYRFGFTPPRWLYILNHLSDSAVPDHYHWYRWIGWPGRLTLWLALFGLSIWWFICTK